MRPTASALVLTLLALPAALAASTEVRLQNGAFSPDVARVDEAAPVVFVNEDDRPHTVTSAWDDGAAVDVVLMPGQSLQVTFEHAGEYPLRCVPHSSHEGGGFSGMTATVLVQAAGAAPARSPYLTAAIAFVAMGALVTVGSAYARARRPRARAMR